MPNEGTIAFYDSKRGFGKIAPSEGGEPVFFHISMLDNRAYTPAAGEPVEYEQELTEKGPAATTVARRLERCSGTVEYFDTRRGFGMIAPDNGDQNIFVHYSDIISSREYKKLEEGQQVEFTIVVGDDARPKAVLVLPDTRTPLERFAKLPAFDKKLEALANMAPEEWTYRYKETSHHLPILYNYIQYTFRRILEENKIAYSEDQADRRRLACFNTGLVTAYYDPIFCAFFENSHEDEDEKWVLSGFFTESQAPIIQFARRPETANYFEDPSDLIYDRRLTLVRNVQHIVEDRIDRFPAHYRDDPRRLAGVVDIAIARAEQRVLRNYKTAIPQYHAGAIQLLLPLCLDDPKTADVALVVGKEGAVYKGYTVLTLDMAYNNARLLTKPDREWLVP